MGMMKKEIELLKQCADVFEEWDSIQWYDDSEWQHSSYDELSDKVNNFLEEYEQAKTEWKPISEMKENTVYWVADNDNNVGVGCLDKEVIKYNLAMTPEEFSKPAMFAEIKPPRR